MINKNIIQTYNSDIKNLPYEAKECIKKWKDKNPSWNYMYFGEQDRLSFIEKNFDSEWIFLYNKLPLGIMKANLFKYMSLYILGGLYVDLDHIPNMPIEKWLDLNKKFVLVGDEDEKEFIFSIAVIASESKNIILKSVLDTVKEKIIENNFKKNIKQSVFEITGEIAFTKGIKKILDPESKIHLTQNYEYYNNSENAKRMNFYCFGGKDKNIFRGNAISNMDAANNWNNYLNWWKEADKFDS